MDPPTHPVLQQIHRIDKSSPSFSDQLNNAIHGPEYLRCVPILGDDDAAWLVNYLDEALDDLDPSNPAFRRCLHELRSICGARAILPTSYKLSSELLNINPKPFARGGYSDVYEGNLDGSRVCMKRMRVHQDDKRVSRIFHQEAVVWKRMTHPNVLPLRGVTIAPDRLAFVSNFMSNGTLRRYIREHPEADRLGLLGDIAEGLNYIHSCSVIHGGIRGSNVLLDEAGHPFIADFGLATVAEDKDSVGNSDEVGTAAVWAAPEVLNGGAFTKQADIFSFAMLMIEVFTGAAPFGGDRPAVMAIMAIAQGKRPPRPKHPAVTGRLWKLIQRCWDQDPDLRPNAAEVLRELRESNPPPWKNLIADTLSMDERIPLLTSIFSDRDEVEVFKYLSREDAQAFIDAIDGALEILHTLPQQIRMRCLRTVYRVCGAQALLPTSLQIPLCYDPLDIPECSGGFADVWKCPLDGREVAAKGLKVYLTTNFERIRRRFCREVVTWRTLHHPNVLPLLGVTMTENRFVMVSEWMKNGNIDDFLIKNPSADRLELLRDSTKGLIYMHDLGIIHGDLKGANIIIDGNGHACLADFSLIGLIPDQTTFVSSCIEGGTLAWMSPELLNPDNADSGKNPRRSTKESDCYALGMVVYEVLSGKVPFDEYGPYVALAKVLGGERPERPKGDAGKLFTDDIWDLVERCWKRNPGDRATAKDVLECLGGSPSSSHPTSQDVDVDSEPHSDDESDATPDDS